MAASNRRKRRWSFVKHAKTIPEWNRRSALCSRATARRCRDKSKRGYERYVGLGILGRNLQVLGKLLLHNKGE